MSKSYHSDERWPERIDPRRVPLGVVSHHLKKYAYASQWCRGLVIDIGCGVGYGTQQLSRFAHLTVGIDVSAEAIEVARTDFDGAGILYVQAAGEHLPLRDSMADLITCFEAIEHFPDPESHLADVARTLKPNGVYVMSTPRAETPPLFRGRSDNPFHTHEFSRRDLEPMLRRHFGSVEVLGQSRIQTATHRLLQRVDVLGLRRLRGLRPLAKKLSRLMQTPPTEEAEMEDFTIGPNLSRATEYVCVCRVPSL